MLIGANHDEGTSFGTRGVGTTQQFLNDIISDGPDNATALTLAALYPDIPEIGIPGTLQGRPPPANLSYGYMWKRAASYGGDLIMHATRRITTEMWAQYNQTAYSYHFNVQPNGPSKLMGATHFQEVAFVFNNLMGNGYNNSVAVDPFANEPPALPQLADIMSRMWVSFVTELDPNQNGGKFYPLGSSRSITAVFSLPEVSTRSSVHTLAFSYSDESSMAFIFSGGSPEYTL